ncbi:MAG: lasso peptide biosynthesis B2 protein [Gemmatimonadota bacterium]
MGALASKLFSLGSRQWRDMFRAQWALLVAQRTVKRLPPGQLTARRDAAEGSAYASEPRVDTRRAQALGDAVRRVAKYGVFRPACLVRSIALQRLLQIDGIQGAIIRVGVRQSEEGMDAHAWVELSGEVIGDSATHVRQYAPLDDLSVVP